MLKHRQLATRRPRLLLTGFTSWSTHPFAAFNPSEHVLPGLATRARLLGYTVETRLLRVDTGVIRSTLENAYAEFLPDFALHMGLHGLNNRINIELGAINQVAGNFEDRQIAPDAALAIDPNYPLNTLRVPVLPVDAIVLALNQGKGNHVFNVLRSAVRFGDKFGCNYCHYLAQGLAQTHGASALFLHLPQDLGQRDQIPETWQKIYTDPKRRQDFGTPMGMVLRDIQFQVGRLCRWWLKTQWRQN